MTSFAEVTRQVRQINDLILSDMKNGNNDQIGLLLSQATRSHLNDTKDWFIRISYTNKKKFLLTLIDDVKKIWTISLLLKSIWNCRPKDAVMSVCERRFWSSYDQVPMDHDRTALPKSKLIEVMANDRKWFQSLDPDDQALVLTELLTISGGPIMWEVMKRAEQIYEQHNQEQLQNLQECEVLTELPPEKKTAVEPIVVKKDQTPRRKSSINQGAESKIVQGQAQKELETNLFLWASTVKSMKDSMKLEELEMTFKDGTKKKIWKVNRPKPEIVETVDMIQLLPSSISKRIFMYLPVTQLGDCARVNKYWSFLVDEMKAEINARQKIDIELEKLRESIMRHDTSLDFMSKSELNTFRTLGSTSTLPKANANVPTVKPGAHNLGMQKRIVSRKKRGATVCKPFRDMADLNERLERRGAADENLWKWCSNIMKINKTSSISIEENENSEGLLSDGKPHFPCPLMPTKLKIPLNPPLTVDPSDKIRFEPESNIAQSTEVEVFEKEGVQRFGLWSRDFSSLYPVCKVPSHQAPF